MRSEMPGWNTYHYTFNNPVIYVDPDGNMPTCCPQDHSLFYSLKYSGADGYNNQTQINNMTAGGTITGVSLYVAFTPTLVAGAADVILNDGGNLGGSSAQAVTASSAMNAFGGRGRLANALVGGTFEVLGGVLSRTLGGETVFDTQDMVTDLFLGSGTSLLSSPLNTLSESIVGQLNLSEGGRRFTIEAFNEVFGTAVGEVGGNVINRIINLELTPASVKSSQEVAPADKTRVYRGF